MKGKHLGVLVLGLVLMAGGVMRGRAQNPPAKGAQSTDAAPEPATLTVEVINRIPPMDRANLKAYWTAVEAHTKGRWIEGLPAAAKPPLSTPGEVKIDCWVHTDGRVTNMVLEEPSGNVTLDRAAWAAITGSVPYDSFPYGIAVAQVRVRFTFVYNGGAPAGSGVRTSRERPS